MERINVSVVVPVYGSERTLRSLWQRLSNVLNSHGLSFEVVFVDDGSRDGSWTLLKNLQTEHPDSIVAIQLMRNFGQHNALMAGFHHVRGQVIITIDDDLQHPPEEIPALLATLRENDLDLVYGTYDRKKHALWRNFGSTLAASFFRSVFRVSVTPTAFRAVRRELVECILSYNRNFTIIDGLLAWSTQRIGATRVSHHPRAEGRSGYSISKLLMQSVNVLTNFSLAPLQFVSITGIATSFAGLSLAAYYLFLYFSSSVGVPGYASLIVTLLVSSGLQLLSLGMIGEYVGRVLLNINQKPQFVERTVLSSYSPDLEEKRSDVCQSR